jgi:ribosome biogenesis protein Nip4
MSYDVSCDRLARSFLRDVKKEDDEEMVKELAQTIQDAIEGFLEEKGLLL